ncbi:MAG: hypothetical protein EOP11_05195 [Proteobacteria bacterium]|nr:MAG: hypothetical protein EOP11_05195 [Pseudomonadota bacterium]
MSFWHRLFGKAAAAPAVLNRSPRIRLLLADGARFETEARAFPLLNISDTGLGLYAENDIPAGNLSGVLHLGDISLPIELEIVRQTGTLVGARIVGNPGVLRATLRQLFLEELRATEMNEVSARADEGEPGTPRWFYAAGNYELFFLEENGQVLRLEMEWSGRVVSARKGEAPRSGHLPKETRDKPGHAKATLVEWEGPISEEERAKAIRILENVPGLEPAVRGQLVALLRR